MNDRSTIPVFQQSHRTEEYKQLLSYLRLKVDINRNINEFVEQEVSFICKSFYEQVAKGETHNVQIPYAYKKPLKPIDNIKLGIKSYTQSVKIFHLTYYEILSPFFKRLIEPNYRWDIEYVNYSYDDIVKIRLITGIPEDRQKLVMSYLSQFNTKIESISQQGI